jgi:hypothetical protein
LLLLSARLALPQLPLAIDSRAFHDEVVVESLAISSGPIQRPEEDSRGGSVTDGATVGVTIIVATGEIDIVGGEEEMSFQHRILYTTASSPANPLHSQ